MPWHFHKPKASCPVQARFIAKVVIDMRFEVEVFGNVVYPSSIKARSENSTNATSNIFSEPLLDCFKFWILFGHHNDN